jgi:hypothetical protein
MVAAAVAEADKIAELALQEEPAPGVRVKMVLHLTMHLQQVLVVVAAVPLRMAYRPLLR